MRTLKFLAVTFLLLAVGFFAVGCATSGDLGSLSERLSKVGTVADKALAEAKAAREEAAEADSVATAADQKATKAQAQAAAAEGKIVDLKKGVDIAVAGSAAAKGVANQSAETSAAALKKAEAANTKADKALKLVSQEVVSPEAAARIDRELSGRPSSPAGSSSGVIDSIKGDGRFYMPLRTGSSEISEENKLTLIAFMEKEHLNIKEVIAVKDRKPPKGKDEDESADLNQALAEKRGTKATNIFKRWIPADPTPRVIDPPSERPKFPGGVIFILGK